MEKENVSLHDSILDYKYLFNWLSFELSELLEKCVIFYLQIKPKANLKVGKWTTKQC